ncbi:uncharacterized protein IL334_004123 [Kwoniella shivajii]|uniref:BZIP domain-containing protein n=1 Tax=Kwoniella shivajii TaxID=564305 RepID=A0ABZ1D0Q9_9TREE|nr:hypothetical protein IL334_004123 [Kwoniella shivajii]
MPSVLSPPSKSYAPLADEVNPSFGNIAPAPTVTRNGTIVYSKRIPSSMSNVSSNDSEDLERVGGHLNNGSEETLSASSSRKGKEREVDEDPENLARFAAKDMARRRAARESRQMAPPESPSSSTTSFSRRPFSVLSTKANRNSIMGLMEGIWPGSPRQNEDPSFSPVPKMVISPTSPDGPSPFSDPPPPAPIAGSAHRRSSSTGSPLASPTDGVGFAYSGPTWRGGQAVQQQEEEPPGPEKWWHALCAWGSDLDGGYDTNQRGGQVGRTNPFE